MSATAEQIKAEVVKIAQGQGGTSGQDLVTAVSTSAKVESVAMQRVLRSMLEKGAVILDSNMNFILPK